MISYERPIKLRDRRKLCENTVFNVYLDNLLDAGGAEVRDYLVVEPKQRTRDLVTGVGVLPFLDGRAALLRVYRHAMARFVWEVPRGFVDAGESDEQAAERELEEESGLGIHPGGLRSMGYIAPEAGLLAARVHLFTAEKCFQKKPYRPAEFGHRGLQWFSLDEIMDLAEKSEIEDPSTLVALYRCASTRES
jgi:ADP-ribose pyrophosphatase